MASSSSHRFIASPDSHSTALPIRLGEASCYVSDPPRVRLTVADGPMHSVVRESLRADGAERSEPRAVADKRSSAPVGQIPLVDALMVVQRAYGLPDFFWRT